MYAADNADTILLIFSKRLGGVHDGKRCMMIKWEKVFAERCQNRLERERKKMRKRKYEFIRRRNPRQQVKYVCSLALLNFHLLNIIHWQPNIRARLSLCAIFLQQTSI